MLEELGTLPCPLLATYSRLNKPPRPEDQGEETKTPQVAANSLQSCPTLCDPIGGSPPGSPVPGILQARTLEWVAIFFSNAWKWKVKGKSLSRIRLFSTPWTAAYQATPSMGFSRQEYWSGVPLPSPSQVETDFIFLGSKITMDGNCSQEIKRHLLLGRKAMTQLDSRLKSGDIILPIKVCIAKAVVFSVVMYGCESWTIKKAERQRMDAFELLVLKKTLENPLDCEEIKPVNPKGNQPWIFTEGTDAEAEAPTLWPLEAKNWLIRKDPGAGKDWGQEKGATENEMVRWHHQLDGREFEQASGDRGGQRSLVCYSPWDGKQLDTTEQLRNVTVSQHLLPPACGGELCSLRRVSFSWSSSRHLDLKLLRDSEPEMPGQATS